MAEESETLLRGLRLERALLPRSHLPRRRSRRPGRADLPPLMAGRAEFDEIAGLLGDILAGAARRVGLASVCAPSSRGACEPSGSRAGRRRPPARAARHPRRAHRVATRGLRVPARRIRPDGRNLSRHLQVLETSGYVQIEKTFEGRRPRSWIAATKAGRKAFASEVAALRTLIAIVDRRTAPKEVRKECG